METTEVKKKGRIKHCYPRKEIYHRWVHSPEYVYTPKGGHMCAGVGNYLRLYKLLYGKTNEEIKEQWLFNKECIIAIIDRDKKRVLINMNYSQHSHMVQDAVPDDYEIFRTNDIINNTDILQNDEELFKIHAKYLIEIIVKCFKQEYLCLADKAKLIYNDKSINYYFNDIKEFVNKHKLKKYDFYKEHFSNYLIKEHNGYNPKTTIILLPSIKDVLTDKMFNNKQKLKIEQHKFYTKYCYGNGVTLKWLKEHWNLIPNKEEAIKYFENKTEFRNQNQWIEKDNKLNWQELIEKNDEILNNYIKNERNRQSKMSEENLHKAIKELNNFNNYSINAWREENVNSQRTITYKCFIPSHRKGQIGKWKDSVLRNNINNFENTQLKLSKDKQNIITSRNVTVPFNDAIIKFKLINKVIDKITNNVNKENVIHYCEPFNNIKVGIYNLRFIKYTEKKTDTGRFLNRKEWLIQIGCHSLWLDDVIDFIKYYHLEKEFGIEERKPDKNFKIQLKK